MEMGMFGVLDLETRFADLQLAFGCKQQAIPAAICRWKIQMRFCQRTTVAVNPLTLIFAVE
jgi:hypothetical protein